jgi:hypothetical protein
MKNKKILNISLLCFTYASLLICFLVAACVGLVIPSATASTVNIGLYQIKQGGASFVLSPASGAVIAFMVISAISFVATLFFNKNVRKVEFVSLFSLVIVFSILLLSSKPNETSIMNQIAQ